MPLGNDYLINARKEKNDEFYTQYEDISSEINKFSEHFKGKVVYCPCDGCLSNFPKYFKDNFETLGLKGLYYTSLTEDCRYYDGRDDVVSGGPIDITSEEFLKKLDECDIVVTNPPFSLFVGFLNNIISRKKEYLIIGSQNTISCKDVFEHLMKEETYLDYGFKGIAGWFMVPSHYEDRATAGEHKEGRIRVSGVIWYTSFNTFENKPFITLRETYYNEDGTTKDDEYPKYDHFRQISGLDEDAIEVKYVKKIPKDYYGYMGVPISFFGKYNPKQFELIQLDHYGPLGNQDNVVNGKQKYRRIYVRRKKA